MNALTEANLGIGVKHTLDGHVEVHMVDGDNDMASVGFVRYTPSQAAQLTSALLRHIHLASALYEGDDE